MTSVKSAREAKENKDYLSVLTELLFQLADDDFILAFRGSEWLGLAPYIEEDVAFSSITQNMMGHAFIYYQLLEQLGAGTVDELAHERSGKMRKNAILLEKVNGTGTYLQSPKFDWAFTVVRHYFYDVNKKIKLNCLQHCSYEPLKHAAINIRKEQYYHLAHWETWFKQLIKAGGEAKTRMMVAVENVWNEFDDVLSLGPRGEEMAKYRLIEREDVIRQTFMNTIGDVFENLELGPLPKLKKMKKSGRIGEHTEDLEKGLAILTEVYTKEPSSSW